MSSITDWSLNAVRARPTRYLPTVLSPEEVQALLRHLSGVYLLVAKLLFGGSLRRGCFSMVIAKTIAPTCPHGS